MDRKQVLPKALVLGVLIMIVSDQLCLLISAVLLQKGILSAESNMICVIVSLVCASFIMAVISVRCYGYRLHSYIAGVIYFLLVLVFSLIGENGAMALSACVKSLVAIFCGCLSGNCIGSLIGYKKPKNSIVKQLNGFFLLINYFLFNLQLLFYSN